MLFEKSCSKALTPDLPHLTHFKTPIQCHNVSQVFSISVHRVHLFCYQCPIAVLFQHTGSQYRGSIIPCNCSRQTQFTTSFTKRYMHLHSTASCCLCSQLVLQAHPQGQASARSRKVLGFSCTCTFGSW